MATNEKRCARCKEGFTTDRPPVQDPETPFTILLHDDCLKLQLRERNAREAAANRILGTLRR